MNFKLYFAKLPVITLPICICIDMVKAFFEWYANLKIESIMSFWLIMSVLPYIIGIFYDNACMKLLEKFCWDCENGNNFNEFLPLIGGFDISVIVFLIPLAFDVYEKIKGKINLKLVPSNFDRRVKRILVFHSIHLSIVVFNILISNFEIGSFTSVLNLILFSSFILLIIMVVNFSLKILSWQINFNLHFLQPYANQLEKEAQEAIK